MNHSLLRTLMLCFTVLMLFLLIRRFLGTWVVVLAVLLALIVCISLYLLRYHRPLMARAYAIGWLKPMIDFLCYLTSEQSPVTRAERDDPLPGLLLRHPHDFEWARRKLNRLVIGHRQVIQELLESLEQRMALLRRTAQPGEPSPLACLLFVGPTGIGKRHLAYSLAQCVFTEGAAMELDLADYADPSTGVAALLGNSGHRGHLTDSVRRSPLQVVLCENLDRASAEVQAELLNIMQSGMAVDGNMGNTIRFDQVIFAFTIQGEVPGGLQREPQNGDRRDSSQWDDQVQHALAEHFQLSPVLLGRMHYVGLFHRPSVFDTASVVAQLMHLECQRFDIEIDFVDPEVIAAEVERFDPLHGFQFTQTRLARKLRRPIFRAKQANSQKLIITNHDW